VLESIEELLAAPAPEQEVAETVARIERTLTDGYAHALALEAERWRLHRKMGEAAVGLEHADRGRVHELSAIADRLAETDAMLVRLRHLLDALRRRSRELRLRSSAQTA
jgi:hypothetical protein